VMMGRLAKRGVDLKSLQSADPVVSGKEVRQAITIRQGIDSALAKRIVKIIKDTRSKTQAAIQEDKVRVTGKKKDELQEAIALLRGTDFGLPLQFNNFRD
jgi:cyclic-di-GMP-binding protein